MVVGKYQFSRFRGRKVLISGHTGFKGSWLSAWLHQLGAHVTGLSLDPPTQPSHFEASAIGNLVSDRRVDITKLAELQCVVEEVQPDFVFHLAAQSLVRQSFINPVETYKTNVLGTLNVLETLRHINHPCVAVLITSDKCYNNVEWVWGYRETDPLGGPDPYSGSKGAAELVINSYVKSFFPQDGLVRVGVGRAGNVIGGGDWANDRVVPDCIRCWAEGESVQLRYPHATRPWQHVLEPLSGYLSLALAVLDQPHIHGEPFNFGPPGDHSYSVQELVRSMADNLPGIKWKESTDSKSDHHESGLLKLNCDKALQYLGWHSILSFHQTVRMTTDWYRDYYNEPTTIRDTTFAQIAEYVSTAQNNNLSWAQPS